ncbi:MAG: hypothetical protein EOP48_33620, partial [Sphingobacteriales bacterium]
MLNLLSIILLQQGYEWRMLFRLPVLLLLVSATAFMIIARDKPEKTSGKVIKEDGDLTWVERYGKVLSNKKFMIATLAFGFDQQFQSF